MSPHLVSYERKIDRDCSQTDGSTDRSAGLAEQINAAPWPANSDLGSLGNDSGSGQDFSDRTVIDQGHVNQMLGDLRSVDDVVADSANAVVFISSVAIGGVAVVELGGAFLATESGIAATEATRQMAIHISISKKMLLFNAGRLHISLTGGEGLGYALANSANTSAYPAWLLARGAVVAAPPAITAIVD